MIKIILIWVLILLLFSVKLSAQSMFFAREPLPNRLDHISTKYHVQISYDRIQLKDLIAPQIVTEGKKLSVLLRQSLQNSGFSLRKESAGQYYIVPIPKGEIAGVILDAESGRPLQGVSIFIKNKLYVSSPDGSFNCSLESGIYSIVLNAVGYENKEILDVHVQPRQSLRVTLTLRKKVVELMPVKVISSINKESIMAFYARQKNAKIITDGLAAEQIKTMPDRNISQLVKHINGVNTIGNTIGVRGQSERYSQVLVDGIELPPFGWNKRELALDLFPKEIISEVVMAKTAMADASSGFSGGQLHIHTLAIPRQSFTSFAMDMGGNTQSLFKTFDRLGKKGKLDFLGVDDGTRKRPGNIVPGQSKTVLNGIVPNNEIPVAGLIPLHGKVWPDYNATFSMGRAYTFSDKATLGFVLGTSLYHQQSLFRINTRRRSIAFGSQDSIANAPMGYGNRFGFLSGTGTVFNVGFQKGTFDVSIKNFLANQLKDDYSEAYRSYSNISSSHDIKELLQEPEQSLIQQHQLKFRKSFSDRGAMQFYFAFTRAVGKINDRRYLQYFRTVDGDGTAVYRTPNIFYGNDLTIDSKRDSGVVSDNRSWFDQSERSYSTGLSFSRHIYTSEKLSLNIKSGWEGIFRRSRFSSYSFLPYTNENENITGQYDQLLNPKVNSQVSYWAENTNGTIYSGKMNNQAFYFLSDNKLYKNLKFAFGLRTEFYDMRINQQTYLNELFSGKIPYGYGNGITGEKKGYWLPSANLFFNVGRKTNLRAAYFKTVLHPSARELSYFTLYEPDMDGNISGRQLLSTTIDNYDMRWEWFPSMRENVSVSLFYKKLKNPVELVQGSPSPYSYSYINQHAARIAGLEIEARKSLAFIAPQSAFKHLTLQASYTINRSKVEALSLPFGDNVQTRMPSQDRPLFNQAPWTFDASLSYDNNFIGFFAFYNTSGPKTFISNTDPNLIEYENDIAQLDMSLYIKCLKNKSRITFNVLNLLNPWHFNYVNPSGYKQTDSHYWKLVNGSVKYNPEDGDVITYRIKQGIKMSIGLTIDF